MQSRTCVLIADTAQAAGDLASALEREPVDIVTAQSYGDAVASAATHRPRVCIVGYHFDELRPYRLIGRIRGEAWGERIRILVVRALPLQEISSEEERLRAAYKELGADDYLSLHDEAQRLGRKAAIAHFQTEVRRLLSEVGE